MSHLFRFIIALLVAAPLTLRAGEGIEVVFEKEGNYSVRVTRCDSAAGRADARLLFAPVTDYNIIYSDSARPRPNFEPVQVLDGVVDEIGGRESVVVMALNCKTGGIFKTFADSKGRFSLNVHEFEDSTTFNIDAFDDMDKRIKFAFSINEPPIPDIPEPAENTRADNTTGYYMRDTVRVLSTVEVTARRKKAMNRYGVEPTRGIYEGDPKIYRYPDIISLLRGMGVYSLKFTTVILDDQIVQRSGDTDDDFTFDSDIEAYLRTIPIDEVWQVEYIKNDPRTAMFQSFQNAHPVLLVFTKYGRSGSKWAGRPQPNTFNPLGHEPNYRNDAEESDGDLILWRPELEVKEPGEKLHIDVSTGVTVSIMGITKDGELIEREFAL